MPWDSPEYEMEGDSSGGGNVVGYIAEWHFEDGEYGPQAVGIVRRSHPELTPNGKAEIRWSWSIAGQKERANWSVVSNGASITHSAGKQINARTDLGKLFKSVKEHLPEPADGFDPRTVASWKKLEALGDVEFGWIEEAKLMPDPANPDGRWIPDPEKADNPKRTLVVVGYTGAGAVNGQVETFDLATLPADKLGALQAAAQGVLPGNGPALQAALFAVPGATGITPLVQALGTPEKAEALRMALTDGEPF